MNRLRNIVGRAKNIAGRCLRASARSLTCCVRPRLEDPDLPPGPQVPPGTWPGSPLALEGQLVRDILLAYQPVECLEAVRDEGFTHMVLENLGVEGIAVQGFPPHAEHERQERILQFYKRCVRLFLVTEHQILELLQNGFIMRCSVTTEPGFGYTIEICWCFLAADGGTRLRVSLAVVGRSRWVPRGTVERQSMQEAQGTVEALMRCLPEWMEAGQGDVAFIDMPGNDIPVLDVAHPIHNFRLPVLVAIGIALLAQIMVMIDVNIDDI